MDMLTKSKIVEELTKGRASEVVGLICDDFDLRISVKEFNDAKEGVLISHSTGNSNSYTVLQFAQTLLHQLKDWRFGEERYQLILECPETVTFSVAQLDQTIKEWECLEGTLLRKASNFQKLDHAARKRLIAEWYAGFQIQRFPAGYFIDLQTMFGWSHQTDYEEENANEYWDTEGNSMYDQHPLNGLGPQKD